MWKISRLTRSKAMESSGQEEDIYMDECLHPVVSAPCRDQ